MVSAHFPPPVIGQSADLQTLFVKVDPGLGIVHILIVLREATITSMQGRFSKKSKREKKRIKHACLSVVKACEGV